MYVTTRRITGEFRTLSGLGTTTGQGPWACGIFVATIVTFLLRLRELRARTAPSKFSLDTQLLPRQLVLPPL